jgi:hypothetical protein
MSNRQKWAVIAGLFLIGAVAGIAQQQFSGGQAVTVTSGTVTATQGSGANLHVDVDSAPTTAVTGTFWQSTQPVSGTFWQSTQPTSLASLPALATGSNVIGITDPLTGCGTTKVESGSPAGFAALAAATTTVESSTTCILTLIVTNTGSSSFTYYVTDNAATPIPVIGSSGNPITILAGERDEYTFPNGSKFNAGIKLTASATTGAYYLLGVQ